MVMDVCWRLGGGGEVQVILCVVSRGVNVIYTLFGGGVKYFLTVSRS